MSDLKEWTLEAWQDPDALQGLKDYALGSQSVPRFHGNGFIQLYVAEERRLHVWHPDLKPTVKNALIHDHRFNMAAFVLFGTLEHTSYEIVSDAKGLYGAYSTTAEGNKAEPMQSLGSTRFHAQVREQFWLARNSRYYFAARKFHATSADEVTITIMDKGPADGGPPRVIAPHNEQPDHAFENQPEVSYMWAAIEDAFTELQMDLEH